MHTHDEPGMTMTEHFGESPVPAPVPAAGRDSDPAAGRSPVPRADWNALADGFDEEPDHGLGDEAVRAAWDMRLRRWLPAAPGDVLDLGCGTGSLSLLAARQGHRVTAVDSAPRMVELAAAKLAGCAAEVLLGDAAVPPVGERRFDVVLVRHVLWTLPDPGRVLRHWRELLRPGGRLVLVEGVWGDVAPVGIPAARLAEALRPLVAETYTEDLTGEDALWGREVTDERYAVVGLSSPSAR